VPWVTVTPRNNPPIVTGLGAGPRGLGASVFPARASLSVSQPFDRIGRQLLSLWEKRRGSRTVCVVNDNDGGLALVAA
jgi:hypothetical protein